MIEKCNRDGPFGDHWTDILLDWFNDNLMSANLKNIVSAQAEMTTNKENFASSNPKLESYISSPSIKKLAKKWMVLNDFHL